MAPKKNTEEKSEKTLQIKYYRSAIACPEKHKLIVKSLGFKRLNQVVTRVDTAAIRGMVAKAPHLFKIISEQSN
jgi:large subunit ribosomal protein L30